MNFVTSVFKKYINKDEAKTPKKSINDAPGPSTAQISKICEVEEANKVAIECDPQVPALLSDEEDCFQDAQTSVATPTNIPINQNKLVTLEAPSNKGSNIAKTLENENIPDPNLFDNSIVEILEPQEAPAESLIDTSRKVFHQDDSPSSQKTDESGKAALDNANVKQAAKFVSLNDILFDSSKKFDTELPKEDSKPQNEDTSKSALEVLIQNVNEAFVGTKDITAQNNEGNHKVQIESILEQENNLDEELSKACKEQDVETQKRKCENVHDEIVKKLKTENYPDFVEVPENVENQNAPEKVVEQFHPKEEGETKHTVICKKRTEENDTRDDKIAESKPEAAYQFPEENKTKSKTDVEINRSEPMTKTTNDQEDKQEPKNNVVDSEKNEEISNIDIDNKMLDQSVNDNQYLKDIADQNLAVQEVEVKKEEGTKKNLRTQSVEMDKFGEKLEAIPENIEHRDGTYEERKNKDEKIKQDSFVNVSLEQNKSLLEIQDQQPQANLERLVTQKEDLSSTEELVNSLTNSESINRTSDNESSLKQVRNKGDTCDLVGAPMIQGDSSRKVMTEENKSSVEIQHQQSQVNLTSSVTRKEDLSPSEVIASTTQEDSFAKVMLEQNMISVEIQDQQAQANLESLVTQKEDLSPTKELVNSLIYSESINEKSLKQDIDALLNAPKIQEDSSGKDNLEQNKSSMEVKDQQAQANLESLVTQQEDFSSKKELISSLTSSKIINKANDNETSIKEPGNKGEPDDLVNAPRIQEDCSGKDKLEQNKSSKEVKDPQAQANLESLVTQQEFPPTKKALNSSTNSTNINKTDNNETSLKQEEKNGDTLESSPMIQVNFSEIEMPEKNMSSVEIQDQQAQANLESLVAQKEDISSTKKEIVHSPSDIKSINKIDELLNQDEEKVQDTYKDLASSDSSVLEKSSVEVEDLNYQDAANVIKNQDTKIQEILNTKIDIPKKLAEEAKQSQANFEAKEIINDPEMVIVGASKLTADLTTEGEYEQNLQKTDEQNGLETKSKSEKLESNLNTKEEPMISGHKTFGRQDTKEFEKLEMECKVNFKSNTAIDEGILWNKSTNFERQDTQEFENLERKLAMHEEKFNSTTDDILDALVAESTLLENKEAGDDQSEIVPNQASETKISSAEKIEEMDTELVAENKKSFFRQDTLEFEKLEKQCKEVACLDVLDELVARSTKNELIESIKCELVSTPCKETNENTFEKTIEENKIEENTVPKDSHQKNKTTFLEIHLQRNKAVDSQDVSVKNKLQIQVHSVNKNKQQTQLSGAVSQRQEKYKTVDEELKSKVDDLQLGLDTIRKTNRRKGKCIDTAKVEKKENGNVISKYKNVINEYEKHIVQQNSDLEKLKIENERNMRHFTNTEMAFSDVFEKYEKAKYVIAAYAKNEDILLENLQNAEEQLTKIETKCAAMKEQSFEQIKQAKKHVEHEKQKYNQELAKLQGQVKRLEIKASSLEVALKQKAEECQALASLCDDITGRNSP